MTALFQNAKNDEIIIDQGEITAAIPMNGGAYIGFPSCNNPQKLREFLKNAVDAAK